MYCIHVGNIYYRTTLFTKVPLKLLFNRKYLEFVHNLNVLYKNIIAFPVNDK